MARKKHKSLSREMRSQVRGILVLALACFCFAGLFWTDQTGGAGRLLQSVLRALAGEAAAVIPVFIAAAGLKMIMPRARIKTRSRFAGILILPLLVMIWIHLRLIAEREPFLSTGNLFFESLLLGLGGEGGGLLGSVFAGVFYYLFGLTGSLIILAALVLIALLLILNISLGGLLKSFSAPVALILKGFRCLTAAARKIFQAIYVFFRTKLEQDREKSKSPADIREAEAEAADLPPDAAGPALPLSCNSPAHLAADDRRAEPGRGQQPEAGEGSDQTDFEKIPAARGRNKSFSGYIFPPLDLLAINNKGDDQQHQKSSKEKARVLEKTLLTFGVRARVSHVQSGPTVTRFEVQPEAGVKVSRIIGLSDDLALNLTAPMVRIEAPIPGKAALGIEVPNSVVSLVHVREVIEENLFQTSLSPLTIGLGKDITGIPVVADLTKMPHLLIAGATGAGKSVCLNTVITSILYKANPDQVRFLMIDPKVVELSVYNGVPHLLMPVITDPRKASLALRNMVREMSRRYDLFAELEVRDISAYNDLAGAEADLEKLPYIVVMIDELADLMHVSPGEVEDAIARLAQMSRAAGIHLIVATQRPSVDVLTGIIKANITSRIAFTVSSQFDSRTILDMAGAEKLLGRGDMLFYPVGAAKPFRVQGAYISEAEVKRVTDFIKEQGLVDYENGDTFLNTAADDEREEMDDLFGEAVDLVVRTGQASISLLQRRFRIGYTRAARLIDDLERKGIVGPFEGSKPREVLITAEQAQVICEEFKKED